MSVLAGFKPAVVDGKLLKIGQDAQRQLGAPAVAAQLKGGMDVFFDVDGRFFGFQEELAGAAHAKAVVRGLGNAAHLDGVFVDDVFIRLGIALLVADIPAQLFEKGIDKLPAQLGFIVSYFFVGIQMGSKGFHQVLNRLRRCHN